MYHLEEKEIQKDNLRTTFVILDLKFLHNICSSSKYSCINRCRHLMSQFTPSVYRFLNCLNIVYRSISSQVSSNEIHVFSGILKRDASKGRLKQET